MKNVFFLHFFDWAFNFVGLCSSRYIYIIIYIYIYILYIYIYIYIYLYGWWFGTFFIFHNIWDNPSQLTKIFDRNRYTTNQIYIYIMRCNICAWNAPPLRHAISEPCPLSPSPWIGRIGPTTTCHPWKSTSTSPGMWSMANERLGLRHVTSCYW